MIVTRTGHVFTSLDEARNMSSPESVTLRVRRSHFFDPTPPIGSIKQRIEVALIVGWVISGKSVSDDAGFDAPVRLYYHRFDSDRSVSGVPQSKGDGLYFDSMGADVKLEGAEVEGETSEPVTVPEGYTFDHGGGAATMTIDTPSILADGAYIKSVSIDSLRDMLSGGPRGFVGRVSSLSVNPTATYADKALTSLATAIEKRAGYVDAMEKVEQYPQIEHSIIDPVREAALQKLKEAGGEEGAVAVEQTRIEVLRGQIAAIEARINSYLDKNFCVTADWSLPFLLTHPEALALLVEAISGNVSDPNIPIGPSQAEVDDFLFHRAARFIGEAIEMQFMRRVIAA